MDEKGFLYCLWNIIYTYYGENVYKLGCSNDIQRRLLNYCTSYIEPSTIIYSTKELRNKILAEKILFKKLNRYRMSSNREFFKCDKETIKQEFENIEILFDKYTDNELIKLYGLSTNKYEKTDIINANNITKDEYSYMHK